jgi:transcriptional regulator NrdR family protein
MCDSCGSVFSTQEQPIRAQGILISSSQRKRPEPFQRDILFLSIYEACKHRPRAIIESGALTDTVMALGLAELHDSVITRDVLTSAAHTVLSRFDAIAADLYAAYHPVTSSTK